MSNDFDPKSVRVGDTVTVKNRYSSNITFDAQVIGSRVDDPNQVFIKYTVVQEEWIDLDRITDIKVIESVKYHKEQLEKENV